MFIADIAVRIAGIIFATLAGLAAIATFGTILELAKVLQREPGSWVRCRNDLNTDLGSDVAVEPIGGDG